MKLLKCLFVATIQAIFMGTAGLKQIEEKQHYEYEKMIMNFNRYKV